MRAKFINEKNFERGRNPKEALRIGKERLEREFKEIQSGGYVGPDTFEGKDDLIIHVFGKVYDKWKKEIGSVTPEDISFVESTTSGGTPIIYYYGPGSGGGTMIRWEKDPVGISDDVLEFLNSQETKQKVADRLNKKSDDPEKLGEMVFKNGNRRKLTFGSIAYAYEIADRLIELLG